MFFANICCDAHRIYVDVHNLLVSRRAKNESREGGAKSTKGRTHFPRNGFRTFELSTGNVPSSVRPWIGFWRKICAATYRGSEEEGPMDGECEMADKVLGGAEFSFNLVCLLI